MTATETAEAPAPTPLSAEQLFDAVGPAYETAFENLDTQHKSIRWLLDQLPSSGAKIVDIGCGTGKPVCYLLAEKGHDVLGIDISGAMIDAARERVTKAKFEKLDIRDFNPPSESFDAVTAYFSLIAGVSQDEIRATLKRVFGFLKPGGFLVWSTVPLDADNLNLSWMGRPTVVSSLGPEDALAAVKDAGFEIVEEMRSQYLPKGAVEAGICGEGDIWEEPHLFVYAKKPTA
ncbi:S-adenosyl-L-methionine-dependent methyltransferase [Rhypophila decipiens]|uniref:S-adenosyl-L-methionine-dependent methyltransferase n=1 Tax=Rhypophila decipiens TaxID=261697 RepID=A0AAN6YAC6_9PEZI|nr:S-adenosyl-L-methionine-dependent methyltransferase [Rhypophila decipiens]